MMSSKEKVRFEIIQPNPKIISGNELVMKMKISLNESLTGFTRSITTLDKREIAITAVPGEFVQHEGQSRLLCQQGYLFFLGVKVAAGEGMPIYRNPFEKGNLVITFEVEYPAAEWFSIAENREALAKLLPPKQDQGIQFLKPDWVGL